MGDGEISLCLVVAAAENNCIGRNNTLPWHLPQDLQYFKRITMGKPIIMGRKTWDSIGRPLPGRTSIVITRQAGFEAEGAVVLASLEEAIEQGRKIAVRDGVDEVMVIGGAAIYQLALPYINRMYFTRVHTDVAGDAFFPDLDWQQWQLQSQEDHAACDKNPHDYSFCVYTKR